MQLRLQLGYGVPAKEIRLSVENMHRPAFPFGRAGVLAKQFGHDSLR